jgi:copper(I)-binding protein
MSNARRRSRSVAASALAIVALTAGLSACVESPEDIAATSTTASTLPAEVPTVSVMWTEPTEDTGPDVRVPVYASIQGGTVDDVLTGISVDGDLAASAELVPAGPLELPANKTVNLDSNGAYIELVGLEEPLEYNHAFELTLEFETAEDLDVHGAVRNPFDPTDGL